MQLTPAALASNSRITHFSPTVSETGTAKHHPNKNTTLMRSHIPYAARCLHEGHPPFVSAVPAPPALGQEQFRIPGCMFLGTWSDPIPKVSKAWGACLNNGSNSQGTQSSNLHGEPVQYPWCGSGRWSKLVCSHLLSLFHWCPAALSLAAWPFIQILAQHRWLHNWSHLNSLNWAPYAD